MAIGGISIIFILGIINFLLVLMQLVGGLRWVGIAFATHKRTGIVLAVTATLHGVLAILAD
jgi:hypothetical protein